MQCDKKLQLIVKDIIAAIDSIQEFVEGMQLEDMHDDDKTSSAVVRKLEVIGEAAKQIPEKIRRKHADIPWQEMAGMRDRLIHAYFGIDYTLVWDVIFNELPRVKESMKAVLRDLENEEGKKQ